MLAEEMAADGERLVRLVEEGSWRGRSGYQTALALTDAFFEFWEEHRPVLRVVDLATDEGDHRFRNIRVKVLNAVVRELAAVIARFQEEGRNTGVEPMAQAGTLVAMLASVAAHHAGFEYWGFRTDDVRAAGGPTGLLGHHRPAPAGGRLSTASGRQPLPLRFVSRAPRHVLG